MNLNFRSFDKNINFTLTSSNSKTNTSTTLLNFESLYTYNLLYHFWSSKSTSRFIVFCFYFDFCIAIAATLFLFGIVPFINITSSSFVVLFFDTRTNIFVANWFSFCTPSFSGMISKYQASFHSKIFLRNLRHWTCKAFKNVLFYEEFHFLSSGNL